MTLRTCSLVVSLALLTSGCASHADRGTAIGGLGGAGLGALIGDASGHSAEGALIGGAIGAVTGAVVGDSMDQESARRNAEIQARTGRQVSGAVTTADVVAMTQSGLSEEIIATHIRTNGVAGRPQAGDLITLKNQGVSDRVVNAMQTAPLAGAPAVAAPVAYPQPVYAAPPAIIVEDPYYCPPVYYAPRHWHHRPPPRVGWSVGISSR
jgi:hypothetical protein